MSGSSPLLPPNCSRLLRRALRAHECGDLDKAERLYNALLQYHPENFGALHGLGQVHYQRGRFDTALVLIQTALRGDAGRAEIPVRPTSCTTSRPASACSCSHFMRRQSGRSPSSIQEGSTSLRPRALSQKAKQCDSPRRKPKMGLERSLFQRAHPITQGGNYNPPEIPVGAFCGKPQRW